MSIKFIVEVVTSERDINGNCYHYAVITNTANREAISGMVGGASNPGHSLSDLGFYFNEFKVIESVIPKRQFQRLVKGQNPWLSTEDISAFTGVTVWHLTVNGADSLCNSKSDKRINVEYSERKLDTGVWCSNCRSANYYRKARQANG